MSHVVKTEKFEGPIAKLHQMIEERHLSISDLSLVSIVEDYLTYVKNLPDMNKEDVSQFISVAAVLILLKSKTLLPELELSEDENRDIVVLENQLKAYELLKNETKKISGRWQKKTLHSGSLSTETTTTMFVPDPKMDLTFFRMYIKQRLQEITPKEEERKEVKVHKVIKIEDALSHVRNIIKKIKNLSFKNLNDGGDERLKEKNKKTVVILFLAVLELVKVGEIDATQEGNFSDILIVDVENF